MTDLDVKTMKAGDLVRLKSGGPVMTVISFQSGTVNVGWFVDTAFHQAALFAESMDPVEPK